jgi:hypothetical protein
VVTRRPLASPARSFGRRSGSSCIAGLGAGGSLRMTEGWSAACVRPPFCHPERRASLSSPVLRPVARNEGSTARDETPGLRRQPRASPAGSFGRRRGSSSIAGLGAGGSLRMTEGWSAACVRPPFCHPERRASLSSPVLRPVARSEGSTARDETPGLRRRPRASPARSFGRRRGASSIAGLGEGGSLRMTEGWSAACVRPPFCHPERRASLSSPMLRPVARNEGSTARDETLGLRRRPPASPASRRGGIVHRGLGCGRLPQDDRRGWMHAYAPFLPRHKRGAVMKRLPRRRGRAPAERCAHACSA